MWIFAGTDEDKSSYSEKQESEEPETGDIYKAKSLASGGDVNSTYERNLMLEEEMTAGAEKISIGNFREKFNIKRSSHGPSHDQTINGLPVPTDNNGYNGNEQVNCKLFPTRNILFFQKKLQILLIFKIVLKLCL